MSVSHARRVHTLTISSPLPLNTQVKHSENTPILSVLLEGHSATGKTAIAAKLAITSGFPYIRMVTPDQVCIRICTL